jgi:hypothetical protein
MERKLKNSARKFSYYNVRFSQAEFRLRDETWKKLVSLLPGKIGSGVVDTFLHMEIERCCRWFETREGNVQRGAAYAAVMRSPGKRQLAPFENLVKGLHLAEVALRAIRETERIHSAEFDELVAFEKISSMYEEAGHMLAKLRAEGKPSTIEPGWPIFVRSVADALKEWDFRAIASGSVYDGTKETWFQTFMFTLNSALPEAVQKRANSRRAFAASVTNALRGNRKSGNART